MSSSTPAKNAPSTTARNAVVRGAWVLGPSGRSREQGSATRDSPGTGLRACFRNRGDPERHRSSSAPMVATMSPAGRCLCQREALTGPQVGAVRVPRGHRRPAQGPGGVVDLGVGRRCVGMGPHEAVDQAPARRPLKARVIAVPVNAGSASAALYSIGGATLGTPEQRRSQLGRHRPGAASRRPRPLPVMSPPAAMTAGRTAARMHSRRATSPQPVSGPCRRRRCPGGRRPRCPGRTRRRPRRRGRHCLGGRGHGDHDARSGSV